VDCGQGSGDGGMRRGGERGRYKNIASVLLRDLAASDTDGAKADVRQKFEKGLAFYKDAYQLLRSLVDNAYPGT